MPKNILTSLLVFSIVLTCSSQTLNEEEQLQRNRYNKFRLERVDKKVKSLRTTKQSTYKSKTTPERISAELFFDKNGNHVRRFDWWANGKLMNNAVFKWNTQNRNTDQLHYDRKNVRKMKRWTSQYDSRGNITEYIRYKKDGETVQDKWEYSYYEDGRKKETVHYNSKGELEDKWSYKCDPEGENLTANLKDTNLVCIKYSEDEDGGKTKIVRTSYGKNKTQKRKYKYDKNENLVFVRFSDNKDNTIYKAFNKFDSNNNRTEVVEYHPRKDVPYKKWTWTYDQDNKVTESKFYENNELKSESKTIRDAKGLNSEHHQYNLKKDKTIVTRYYYSFY